MIKLDLKKKLSLIGTLPAICFILSMLTFPYQSYNLFLDAKTLSNKMSVIDAASEVVHETQKERGKSAAYLNGGIEIASLNQQRAVNDQKINKLKEVVNQSNLDNNYKNEIIEEVNRLKDLRDQVSSKEVKVPTAIRQFTQIIKRLLDIQLETAKATKLAKISTKLKAFRILEEAKESGGKLRANIAAILSKNEAISDNDFAKIISLKAGVDIGLASKALVLDNKSTTIIQNFKNSSEWKTVNETLQKS